ncbi:hypothetical protein [Rubellimicrobium aerolatum]|uniref:Uncharacterized protein n=1 Tax=Rubellimicrobium aerolatum TaxID=490979 RepID=A0ABW0SDC2_9RHOB|nr:hypothetical protein [Rubellimicrobium aerolatum]MBP1806709.1 hypothetical protein [Rubellimicrobium aerolatum]
MTSLTAKIDISESSPSLRALRLVECPEPVDEEDLRAAWQLLQDTGVADALAGMDLASRHEELLALGFITQTRRFH